MIVTTHEVLLDLLNCEVSQTLVPEADYRVSVARSESCEKYGLCPSIRNYLNCANNFISCCCLYLHHLHINTVAQ